MTSEGPRHRNEAVTPVLDFLVVYFLLALTETERLGTIIFKAASVTMPPKVSFVILIDSFGYGTITFSQPSIVSSLGSPGLPCSLLFLQSVTWVRKSNACVSSFSQCL
jgi:hypothetical protein